MQKILFLVLVVVIIVFQYELWYGRGGIYDSKSLEKLISHQQQANQQLQQRNDLVVSHLQELKGSKELLEARARKELNLIRPNELLLIIPNDNSLTKSSTKAN